MIEFDYKTHHMTVVVSSYTTNDNLYVGLEDEDGELWDMTVNLGEKLPPNQAYIDTNNFRDAATIIPNMKLGKFIGKVGYSGFCKYPLYEFDMEKMKS